MNEAVSCHTTWLTPRCTAAGYLEEEEDVEEEGLAEDMRESQRQRMLGGRGRWGAAMALCREGRQHSGALGLCCSRAGPSSVPSACEKVDDTLPPFLCMVA